MKYTDTIIIIPARFNSTRLPGKSLADINGLPMVVRVMKIAESLKLCDVVVATEDKKVVDTVLSHGGKAILTSNNLQSGTDRVFHALKKIGGKYNYIINLQGDMPNIDGKIIREVITILHKKKDIDILTAVYKIVDQKWRDKSQCVKAVFAYNKDKNFHKCIYFSRSNIPNGSGDAYAHVGIYGYTKKSLKKFVSLPVSLLEKSEKLEQLRAIENGMSVHTIIVNSFPISVDVLDDLKIARKYIKL